jgi:hypothetical protein
MILYSTTFAVAYVIAVGIIIVKVAHHGEFIGQHGFASVFLYTILLTPTKWLSAAENHFVTVSKMVYAVLYSAACFNNRFSAVPRDTTGTHNARTIRAAHLHLRYRPGGVRSIAQQTSLRLPLRLDTSARN